MNGLEVYLFSIEESIAKQMGIGTNMTRGFSGMLTLVGHICIFWNIDVRRYEILTNHSKYNQMTCFP